MSNLFSSFEPSALLNLSLNWISIFIIISIIPRSFWLPYNQFQIAFSSLILYIAKEFKTILNPNSTPGLLIVSLGLFAYILINNFFGLFPYIFTASRHLTFSVSLALPLWIGHIIWGRVKYPQSILAHLVPLGTPPALMPLMVLIEITRRIIRPLTLSVRLAANIIAGHLLLTLLANHSANISISLFSVVIILLLLLCILETAVRIIQTYVFRVLSTLYVNEVNSPKVR